jgi:hypothetical protein
MPRAASTLRASFQLSERPGPERRTKMMVKIRRLKAEGFRGIRRSEPLEFTDRCKSMIIFGENGYGKSSFVDAIECFLGNRIGHLERESVGRAAYRHRALPGDAVATVEVEFSDNRYSSALTMDSNRSIRQGNTTPEFHDFLARSQCERVILRQRELANFVDKTKREKLEDIAPLLGLECVDDLRNQLRTASRELAEDVHSVEAKLEERRKSLRALLGQESVEIGDLQAWARQEAKKLGIDEKMVGCADLKTALAGVAASAQTGERESRLQAIQDAQVRCDALGRVEVNVDQLPDFQAAFNSLAADREALHRLALRQLYDAGARVIAQGIWTEDTCPLCLQSVDDLTVLAKDLVRRLEEAAGVEQRRAEIEQKRRVALARIEALAGTALGAAEMKLEHPAISRVSSAARELRARCDSLRQIVGTSLSPGATLALDKDALVESLDRSRQAGLDAIQALAVESEALKPSEEERARLEAFGQLTALASDWERLEALLAEYGVVSRQSSSLQRILQAFEDLERHLMSDILSRISATVTAFYKSLHPGEDYDDVVLHFLPDDRGVEFSLVAYGEHVSPPRLVLSESHLNSLGICLFLAAAREFNRVNRFLVLDDIVNSFDAGHRGQLAELLVRELSDFQLVVLTHDPIWFDMLRRIAPAAEWEFRKIVGWSYYQGVEMELSPRDQLARVDRAITTGEESWAGNLLRQHMEGRLKFLCEAVGARVRYRSGYRNERRTAGELLQDLHAHLRHRRFDDAGEPVWNSLQACAFVTTIASHDQRQPITGLSMGDIRYARQKIEELENLFECVNCNRPVWYAKVSEADFIMQCECGQLKLS